MNVFVVGWSPSGDVSESTAVQAMAHADVLHEKLGGQSLQSWRSPDGRVVVAWLQHDGEQVPGARYVHVEPERMALFAGLPFVWTEEYEGDGVSPLDAAFFLGRDLSGHELDGRFAVARYDSSVGVLEVLTDRLGAYPLFAAEARRVTWIGNAPFVISQAAGKTELDRAALGHFLTIGWSLGGAPIWDGVDRLPRATHEVHRPDGSVIRRELLPLDALAETFGGRPHMPEAARILRGTIAAQSAWPGRPNVVPVSGGRDSRVVLAAAVSAGVEFTSRTIAFQRAAGYPNTPDVVISGEVMAALGRDRHVIEPLVSVDLRWSARLVRQATHGLMSLLETGLVGPNASVEPLEIIHSGSGGELSRGLLFVDDAPDDSALADAIFSNWVYRIPQPITSDEAIAATRRFVQEWVVHHRTATIEPSDIPDLFWLLERMQHWVAPPQHLQEASNDTTAPLWSPRMLPFTFAGSSRERRSEPLHLALLQELAPDLARIPFDGINPAWPTFPVGRGRKQRALILKVRREAQRRFAARRAQRSGTLDPLLSRARDEVNEALVVLDDHVVWDVLDARRVRKLLDRELYTLDPRSQALLWRLATVVAADLPAD